MPQWESVLRWSLAQQTGAGGEGGPAAYEMSEEDKEFLRAALADIENGNGFEDDTAAMRRCLALAALPARSDEGKEGDDGSGVADGVRPDALDELSELVENIDNARDLRQLGGLTLLKRLMAPDSGSSDPECAELRRLACRVLGRACQNHEQVQRWWLEADIMKDFIAVMGATAPSDGEGAGTRIDTQAALEGVAACSHFIRGCPDAASSFVELGGVDVLIEALESPSASSRLLAKSLHLLRHLLREGVSLGLEGSNRDKRGAQLLAVTLSSLDSEDRNAREASMMLLVDMVDGGGVGATLVRDESRDIVAALEGLKSRMEAEGEGAVIDDVQLCERLLNTINGPLPAA